MKRILTVSALGAGLVAASCHGLSSDPDCLDYGTCEVPSGADGGDGSVVVPADCDLAVSPKDSAACVDDGVGVFVSPEGADGAAGTKAAPLRSIAEAVARAATSGKPRVYVCEGSYDQNVTVESAVGIFGGFECTAWEHSGAKPKLAPPKGVSLTIKGVTAEVVVEDLEVVGSADAAVPGDSAIAVFVSESKVELRTVALKAGGGTAGVKAASRSNYSGSAATSGGTTSGATAGAGPACTCVDGTSSKGGNGATGAGVGVEDGSSNPAVGATNAGSSSTVTCGDGTVGANGAASGAGAAATAPGLLSASGWGAATTPGNAPNGSPAQGGGGGGAKTSPNIGGGGGGCGGCGGAGGEPGTHGGSSFPLLSFNSTVIVEGGALVSAAAGSGGDGGDGQAGQAGGALGAGACNGGPGGHGAGGSGGGGGAGGHSAPIAFVGTEPRVSGATLTPGAKGAGGDGGQSGAGPGNAGVVGESGPDGTAQDVLAL
jgi:hypothetical protein